MRTAYVRAAYVRTAVRTTDGFPGGMARSGGRIGQRAHDGAHSAQLDVNLLPATAVNGEGRSLCSSAWTLPDRRVRPLGRLPSRAEGVVVVPTAVRMARLCGSRNVDCAAAAVAQAGAHRAERGARAAIATGL